MALPVARAILELDPKAADIDERLESLLSSDPAFASRLLAAVSMPGLSSRRGDTEVADLRPLFGLRFVQQVTAGLLLEDAGVDATGAAILSAIAAHAVATRVPLPKSEEVFLSAWLNATPAWRQAPATWGPTSAVAAALDRHAKMPVGAQLVADRADLMGQAVRLGEGLANLASRYPESGVFDAMQRAARLGLAPRDLAALAADIARHAAEWSRLLGRDIPVELKLDLDAPGNTAAVRFASELAETYRYLLQNAAIDAETGLPNARYFRTRLETEWAAARRRGAALSVIAVEFEGDAVKTARTMRETARMQDVVCRTGETQLVLICTDTHAEFAEKAAARLEKSAAQNECKVYLGVATLDSLISSVDDLIERAQSASHDAHVGGTGYKVWTAE
ncbi:MAG: diguanylate cyclase response regulator [Betaproteobacteria bacterium]|nr:diguanylate cyclase response regulator [Betaproteobacteria bacterium]